MFLHNTRACAAVMRLFEIPPILTSLVLTVLLSRPTIAGLLPDLLKTFEALQDVRKRCDNPCGYYGQLCCEANEVCYTDSNNQAQCGAGTTTTAKTGQWEYYTTTYVQTDLQTVTETFSSYIPQSTISCSYSLGETPCGNVCCLSGQYCQATGVCADVGGGSSGYYSSLYTVTTIVTNTASAPLRPTSNTLVTVHKRRNRYHNSAVRDARRNWREHHRRTVVKFRWRLEWRCYCRDRYWCHCWHYTAPSVLRLLHLQRLDWWTLGHLWSGTASEKT